MDVRNDLPFSHRFAASRLQIYDCLKFYLLVANRHQKKAGQLVLHASGIHPLQKVHLQEWLNPIPLRQKIEVP